MRAAGRVDLTVDGRPVQARVGQTLLELIREQDLGDVPTLCHWPGLQPWAGCGLCAVEVAGLPGTVPACDTPVAAGLEVTTRGERVERARLTALELLLEEHGAACQRVDGAPPGAEPCALCDLARELGVDPGAPAATRRRPVDDSHPLLWHDPDRCVLCGRCIRACAAAHGTCALALVGQGADARIAPVFGENLAASGCQGCGTCAEACPTGALRAQLPRVPRPPPAGAWVHTTCSLCGLACAVVQRIHKDGVVLVRADGPAGTQQLGVCRRGRFGPGFLLGAPALRESAVIEGDAQVPAPLSEAVARAASLLHGCVERHGADAVMVVVSANLTLEASHLCRRLAEEGLGTTQIGYLRGQGRPSLEEPSGWTGFGAEAALGSADLVLIVGADPELHQPVLARGVLAAARRGAEVVVIHSDPIDLAGGSSVWLDPRRGTQAVLLAALLGRLHPAEMRDRHAPALPEAAAICGLTEDALESLAARLVRAQRVVALYDLDDHSQRSAGDLAMLTRILALKGCLDSGLLLLRDEAGAYGAALAGLDTDLDAIAVAGRVRGAVVIGVDPLSELDRAPPLRDLEVLVALATSPGATTRAAQVVLPLPRLLEREGTFLSMDGRLRAVRPLRAPAAGRGILDVLAALGEALGAGPLPRSAAALRAEIAMEHGLAPDVIERVRERGDPWPVTWAPQILPWTGPIVPSPATTAPRRLAPLLRLVDEGLARLEKKKRNP